jgi:uncharacterized protein YihD (DUF1040 family)
MNYIGLKILTLFSILLITTGCSLINPTYDVTIDAITNTKESTLPTSYIIKAKNNDLNSITLLHKVLKERGYIEAKNETVAQQIIYFDYGIKKDHEEKDVYVDPELSFSGYGVVKPYEGIQYDPLRGGIGYYDNDFYKGTFRTYTTTYIYYDRYLNLLAKDKSAKEIWRVDVSSIGESENVKKIIPLLIKATKPYLGKTTINPIEFVVKAK